MGLSIGQGMQLFSENRRKNQEHKDNLKIAQGNLKLRQDMFEQEMMEKQAEREQVERLRGAISGSQKFIQGIDPVKTPEQEIITQIDRPRAQQEKGYGVPIGDFLSDALSDESIAKFPQQEPKTITKSREVSEVPSDIQSDINAVINAGESKKVSIGDLFTEDLGGIADVYKTANERNKILKKGKNVERFASQLAMERSDDPDERTAISRKITADLLAGKPLTRIEETSFPESPVGVEKLPEQTSASDFLEGAMPEANEFQGALSPLATESTIIPAQIKSDDEIAEEVEKGLLGIDGFLELPQATQEGIRKMAFLAEDQKRGRELHEATVGSKHADIQTKNMKIASGVAELNRLRSLGGAPLEDAHKLRTQYQGLKTMKDFNVVQSAFEKVEFAGDPNRTPTAQSDLALIFSFMRILDPSSVVRESEFATAKDAQEWYGDFDNVGNFELPEFIKRKIEEVQSGRILSEKSRANMIAEARGAFQGQVETAVKGIRQYTDFEDEQQWRSGIVVPKEDRALLKSYDDGSLLRGTSNATSGRVGRFTYTTK